jgi:hypothetical protein
MLINDELSLGAFLFSALLQLYPGYYYLTYHFIPTIAEYQPYVYSTLLFPPATQTYCSEDKEDLEYYDMEFLGERLPPVNCLWSYDVFPM